MTLCWYGDKAYAAVRSDARRKVREACLATEREIKSSMRLGGRTESGMAVLKEGTKGTMIDPTTGAKAGKINSYRSRPGEIPRVQTGTLRRSYTHEMDPVMPVGRVGTNLVYAKFLEFGTRFMAPRPHVRVALEKLRAVYGSIFNVPIAAAPYIPKRSEEADGGE